MSPRPYQLGQRQAATELTRARILNAARALLMESSGYSHFSIDAIARQADVARMTVYHQFGSKIGLLEGLCDSLAASGGMEQLVTAFRQAEPIDALREYLLVFNRFWEVDRLVMRRLRALAALDPDFEQVIRTRDDWRRRGVRAIAERLVERHVLSPGEALDKTVDILLTLSSFETFDTLAGPTRSMEEVAPLLYQLTRAALKLDST
ncbi:MAG TPA: TetR/AcrR family transcriptional regulator [Ktedonobacteraceae bacterium]